MNVPHVPKPGGFNLSALAVRERSVTLFLIIVIFVAGIFAFNRLGRAEDPSFTIKAMTFYTVWPGATAQEMQNQVAEPLEKRMQELKWYDRSETFTRPGLAFTTLTLRDNTPPKEVEEEFYQARKKLGDEQLKLPQGVLGPFINDEYSDVTFGLYALKAHGVPQRVLVREAEGLRQQLLHVPGVKKINIIGERPEKIFVEFDYRKLAAMGLSAQQIFQALNDQNVVTPGGSIETRGPTVVARFDGNFDALDKIAATPIVVGGKTVKLADVAQVHRGYEDPATFLVRNQGEPALLLGVVMKDRYNGLALGKDLESAAAQIQQGLPAGVTFTKVTDQAVNIKEAYDEFMLKFFVALVVVVVVSLVSMGWRVGIVVAAAVPLTLAAVFVIMLVTGRDFDRITLGALILALGLLVDDAIIVIEAMVVSLEQGIDRITASARAWHTTAAPMLAGTLVTAIGLMPVGFAQSSAGEYAGNIFWVVMFALLTSWVVAVAFTPYIGVKLLPAIQPVAGGHAAIYGTPGYRRLRSLIAGAVNNRRKVVAGVAAVFLVAFFFLGFVKQQFFPMSDRPEVLLEVQMPEGTSITQTEKNVVAVEAWLKKQPEARLVTSYIGQGAPRFYLAMAPELPDPAFAKLVILTGSEAQREALIARARLAAARGLAPAARIRVTKLVFGPYSHFPVSFRVMGPDEATVRSIAGKLQTIMLNEKGLRQVNTDWNERVPSAHFVLDQDRLHAIGLSSHDAALQLQFLLTGVPVSVVREDIRQVEVIARSAGTDRLDPAMLHAFTFQGANGQRVPLDQIGHIEVRDENPIMHRRDRLVTMTVEADVADTQQPPDVANQVIRDMQPLVASLPQGYRIETGSALEESAKANVALAAVFPVMLILMMLVIIFQVRSMSAMAMILLTAPLALVGVVPTLLLFNQPFGFNTILGTIALAGIIMRNTLILIGQIHANERDGYSAYDAVVEATVQRARPVVLTALAAVLAFIPLTFSVFWGSLAYTLIGGTLGGTVLTLVFLPPLYALWFRIKPPAAAEPDVAAHAQLPEPVIA
jgi:multidrug efflux pump subunit AcrB